MPAQITNLNYDAHAERLTGIVGKEKFDIKAYSGGGRGHTKVNHQTALSYRHSEEKSIFSRFANTPMVGKGTTKRPYEQRGGTLPPGHYSCKYLKDHHTFGECIYIKRDADTRIKHPTSSGVSLDNRGDDFYIHGSGPKGSDGCIVIPNHKVRQRLNRAIEEFSQQGHVILLVTNVAYLLPAERDDVAIA